MSITAIVPVWNGRALLERLLASLASQTERAEEVLAIDNGSDDGAPDVAEAAGARVVRMGTNAGFAAAVNRGIKESRTPWIAVLNSDVELTPEYFARLRAADAWFATGKILDEDGARIDGTFDLLSRAGAPWRAGHGLPDGPRFARPRRIYSAPFTAALFRADLFRKIGLLDEAYESYLEDVDFGLRCAAAHCAGEYVPQAVARHKGSASLGPWHPETVRRMSRNQLLLLARHYPRDVLYRSWWPIAAGQALWGAVAARHGAGLAWLRGKCEGARLFSEARDRSRPIAPEVLGALLDDNERLIRDLQPRQACEIYWKLYFLLTGGGTK